MGLAGLQCIDHGLIQVPADEYRSSLHKIAAMIRPISAKLVFVGPPACDETKTRPAVWGDYHYDNNSIKTYEDILAVVAQKEGVAFIPIFDKFMAALTPGVDLLPDGLHPNNAGHGLIASLVRPELDKLLVS